MAMQFLRNGASSGLLKYFLMGLLVLAGGGLVLTDVGGFFRDGGISKVDVGRAGNESIHINHFDRIVRRTLPRLGMSSEEAYRLGYINQLLASELRSLLLNQAASGIGLNVGRDHLASEVHKLVKPMAHDGQDTQDVLEQILLNQGMSEQDFVESMKREVENGLLSSAINSGFASLSKSLASDLHKFQNEMRDINMITFLNRDLKVSAPTDKQIENLYQSSKATFAIPEMRQVSLLKIKASALESTIDITEDNVRSVYNDDIEAYTTASQRTLEQAVLETEADADNVVAGVKSGATLKVAVKNTTDKDTPYIGEGSFEEDGLLEEIGTLVFAAQSGDVIGPVKTALGWHVMVLKSIDAPVVQSFNSVKAEIKRELLQMELSDSIYEMANIVDDIFAGGGTIEEAKQEVEIDVVALPLINSHGLDENGKDAFADNEKQRDIILEAAFEFFEGETSPVMEMADGGFMAVSVTSVIPTSYRPLNDVKVELAKRWTKDQQELSNKFSTMAQLIKLEESKGSFAAFAKSNGKTVKSIKNIKRQSTDKKPLNAKVLHKIYSIPVGGYDVIEIDGAYAIVEVTSSKLPTQSAKNTKAIDVFHTNLTRTAQDEALSSYIQGKNEEYGTRINTKLIDQVYGPSSAQ